MLLSGLLIIIFGLCVIKDDIGLLGQFDNLILRLRKNYSRR